MRSPDQVGGWHRTRKADNDTKLWNLEFPKIRHYEALKKDGAISFIKPWTRLLWNFERDYSLCFAPSQWRRFWNSLALRSSGQVGGWHRTRKVDNFYRDCFGRFTPSQWRNFRRNFKWDCLGRFAPSQWRNFRRNFERDCFGRFTPL